MLRIRLFRIGKKHQPSFKIVVVDKKRAPKGGRFVDELGFINPLTKEKSVDKEKAKQAVQEAHYAKVEAEYAAGYRPGSKQLLDGVAELVISEDEDNMKYTAEELAMADRFLKSLRI